MNAARSLHQPFLPGEGQTRAFVWKYSPAIGGKRPRHFHSEPEFNLIASGSAVFGVGESVVRVSQGDLLGFPPAQDHVLLEASPDLYLFAFGLSPALSAEVLRTEHDEMMLPLHLHLGRDDFGDLVRRATAILERGGVDQPCAELWQRAHWLGKRRAHSKMHVLTRWALSSLSQDPSIGLQGLSAKKGTSQSEVSRYFHRDIGMTFVQYRTRARLLQLIRLMDMRGANLADAARASGFGSYSQCHRSFQAELGCSPRQFFSAGRRQEMQRTFDP